MDETQQSRGVATDMSPVNGSLMVAVGYRAVIGDYYVNNVRSEHLTQHRPGRADGELIGRVPHVGYMPHVGSWTDCIFQLFSLHDRPPISIFHQQLWRQSVDGQKLLERAKL